MHCLYIFFLSFIIGFPFVFDDEQVN